METVLNAPRILFTWIRYAIRFLYASRYLLVAGLAVGLLAGAAVSLTEPGLYRSTAVVSLEPQVFNQNAMLSMEGLVANYGLQLQSERQMANVVDTRGWQDPPADLARRVSVTADAEEFTLTIRVLDPSPQHAVEVADGLVRTFEEEIERINLRREREDRIRLNVLQPASPGVQASPQWTRNLVGGAILGLVIGIAVGALRAWRRRDRILDPLEAEDVLRAPTLGTIPR